MRLIDADAYIKYCDDNCIPLNDYAVNAQPTIIPFNIDIDAVPVVRCKNCKWYKHEEEDEVGMGWCANFKPASNEHFICWDNWYCGDGERKDG